MEEDEIELDIIEQSWAIPGIKPWIVIEAVSGEIIDSEDMKSWNYIKRIMQKYNEEDDRPIRGSEIWGDDDARREAPTKA